ncbi:hypothetical protein [Streptomyces sp. NPDC127098]|uniref:hypothetical protein n=1 Tax=Streptomyces sp. NPDC127098 TaxID=3347137 RepID=UPI003655899C
MNYRVVIPVDVNADTIKVADVVTIGGRELRVCDMIALPGRAKRLVFESGETFTMLPSTLMSVDRVQPNTALRRPYRQLKGR